MEQECLFCRIRDKKSPSAVVYEDGRTLAFLDIMARAPGHTVVISKQHSENLLDLPKSELAPLFETVQKVAERLTSVLKADGLTVGINQGSVSGQVVKHLHIHVMPRFTGDGGSAIQSLVHNPPTQSMEELYALLKMS